ncbi:MAG: GNAT family N-acetyltransferase [Negativicutes bacterium]
MGRKVDNCKINLGAISQGNLLLLTNDLFFVLLIILVIKNKLLPVQDKKIEYISARFCEERRAMDGLIIRRTLASDIPKVAKILSSTEAWSCYGITYDIARQMLEKMPDDSFVGIIDNEVVGFITLRIDGVGNIGAYTRMVVVAEVYRGKAIGSKLIDYVSCIPEKLYQ